MISVVSTSSENVLRMTVRTNRTRRLSVSSQLGSVNIPIVIVTSDDSESHALRFAWDKGYKNFKFRCHDINVTASQSVLSSSYLQTDEINPRERAIFREENEVIREQTK